MSWDHKQIRSKHTKSVSNIADEKAFVASPQKFGLRGRVAIAWALVAGLMIAGGGGLTFTLVRNYLVLQRDQITSRQAYSNARVVKDTLRSPNPNVVALLESLRSESGSFPLIRINSKWYGTTGQGPAVIPETMIATLDAGVNGRQRFEYHKISYIAVGLSLPAVSAHYVEVFPQTTLVHTLNALSRAFVLGAFAAILFGGIFGWWAAASVLSPLGKIAKASQAVGAGKFDTRLGPERDRDLSRLVSSFNTMADAVEKRIDREARFASDVSHQLRTPLGALSAAAQVLLRRRSDFNERTGQAIDVIDSQISRLSTMVIDLLEIARIEAGVADVNLAPTQMEQLVRLVLSNAQIDTSIVQIQDTLCLCLVDRRRFEQIMLNLVDNASKYGHGVRSVVVSASSQTLYVHVDDFGDAQSLPIPDNERVHIFERFVRGDGTQNIKGTGLGLALAREQAHLMDASITVTSAPVCGTRFTIAIPSFIEQDGDASL